MTSMEEEPNHQSINDDGYRSIPVRAHIRNSTVKFNHHFTLKYDNYRIYKQLSFVKTFKNMKYVMLVVEIRVH